MKKMKAMTRKEKIYELMTRPYTVVLVMVFAPMLNYLDRNFSYFFGLGVALLILWSSRFNWGLFGFENRITRKTVIQALWITMGLIIVDVGLSLLVEFYFGQPNLSSLEGIKHDTAEYVITLVIVWVFAAFGEELLFRGYYMKWLARLMKDGNKAWLASGIITSLYFGISHYYQGIAGVISVTLWAFIIAFIFYKRRNSLGLLILIHGIHDTYGLTLLYLDTEDPIAQFLGCMVMW